jgi:hypothetical protein
MFCSSVPRRDSERCMITSFITRDSEKCAFVRAIRWALSASHTASNRRQTFHHAINGRTHQTEAQPHEAPLECLDRSPRVRGASAPYSRTTSECYAGLNISPWLFRRYKVTNLHRSECGRGLMNSWIAWIAWIAWMAGDGPLAVAATAALTPPIAVTVNVSFWHG